MLKKNGRHISLGAKNTKLKTRVSEVDSVAKYEPCKLLFSLARLFSQPTALLLFEGILLTLFFPLDFEGKIH